MLGTDAGGEIAGYRGAGGARASEGNFGKSKIENLGMAALGDEDICGLDVAMHDALGVCGVEAVGDFGGQREQLFGFDGLTGDAMLQGEAVEKFHGDEGLAVLFADVVDSADVVVIERGSGLRFTLKPSEGLRVARDVLRQKFQRDEAAQARVFGFVNDAHASAAEFFDDAIVRNGLADQRGRIWHWLDMVSGGMPQVNESTSVVAAK